MALSGSRQMEEHGLPEIRSGRAGKALVMVSNISQYGQSGGRKFGGRHRLTGDAKGGSPWRE